MDTIIKKCPSCGEIVEFMPDDKYVKCHKCHRNFNIIKSHNSDGDDNYNLVIKDNNSIYIVILIILVLTFTFLIIDTIKKNNSLRKNNYTYSDKAELDRNLKSINNLNDSEEKYFERKSLDEINKWNNTDNDIVLARHDHLGYYLLQTNDTSTLYDVYELTYNINNKKYKVVTGVEYNNVTDKGVDNGSIQIHGTTLIRDGKSIWGYDSIEDFYNDIQLTKGVRVTASKGLYLK